MLCCACGPASAADLLPPPTHAPPRPAHSAPALLCPATTEAPTLPTGARCTRAARAPWLLRLCMCSSGWWACSTSPPRTHTRLTGAAVRHTGAGWSVVQVQAGLWCSCRRVGRCSRRVAGAVGARCVWVQGCRPKEQPQSRSTVAAPEQQPTGAASPAYVRPNCSRPELDCRCRRRPCRSRLVWLLALVLAPFVAALQYTTQVRPPAVLCMAALVHYASNASPLACR